jgi:N-methylhydantoinase A
MEVKGHQLLEKEGIAREKRYFKGSMDMRYKGQFHEVEVPITTDELTGKKIAQVVERFHQRHETLYAYRDTVDTEIINLRLAAYGHVATPSRRAQDILIKDPSKHIKEQREVYFEELGGLSSVPVYDGDTMDAGNVLEGPAIVEQRTTTIVVPPKFRLEVTSYLDYMMYLSE